MQSVAQTQNKLPPAPRPNCLGCVDCAGICRDFIDLVQIPQTILHRTSFSG